MLKIGARRLRLHSYLELALSKLPWILNPRLLGRPLLINEYRTIMKHARQVQPVSRKLTFHV
jgi:hypothetical protein